MNRVTDMILTNIEISYRHESTVGDTYIWSVKPLNVMLHTESVWKIRVLMFKNLFEI